MKRGLIVVFTGKGKGKTTAALGCAFRAIGHGCRVCMIQFVKGTWKSGELVTVKRFSDLMELHTLRKGFITSADDVEKYRDAALEAWEFSKKVIHQLKYDMVILDELTYLTKYSLISERDVLDVLTHKPEGIHLIITGRDAPVSLVNAADLVTEMKEIKHPLKGGIKCQKGIEY